MRPHASPSTLLSVGLVATLLPALAAAQTVAVYRGTAKRATADANAKPTNAELAFHSFDPGVLDGTAGLEALGEKGDFVGRLDGRVLAVVSRTDTHHLAWTGSIDPATGHLSGAIRAIPLAGGAVEVWSYELAPEKAADGVVTELRVGNGERTPSDDTATTVTTSAAKAAPPPLVGEWEFYTFIDDLPQTRPFYIENVSGTLFVFRLGSFDAPEETGTYDPANKELRFISGGYTYEAKMTRSRKGDWELRGPMRRGTAAVADATDSRGSVRATRVGDLPPELANKPKP